MSTTKRLGIVMNGVTGRMGTNQHLLRSIVAIMRQGGVRCGDGTVVMPEPILTGRNETKLRALAERCASELDGHAPAWTTDVEAAIRSDDCDVVFDASTTPQRGRFVTLAAEAGRAIYCEKPTAVSTAEALRLADMCERARVPNGVVQDKLWLPGIVKLRRLVEAGFFGEILSIRGSFGYWVFTGLDADQPAQRPSWNYRAEEGGGIILDMFCHWQYVLDHTFGDVCGPLTRLAAWARTDVPTRVDEAGRTYAATADDAAYAMFLLGGRVMAFFDSSWCTRVRRDDLLTMQVDGTEGSAVAGLRDCRVQRRADTPRPVWNPDMPQPIDFHAGWQPVDEGEAFDNAFKSQWQLFLRHVVEGSPFPWTLRAGARGVQLAELGTRSWRDGVWVDVPDLGEGA